MIFTKSTIFIPPAARGGNAGKMGLGLAICMALVTSQDGVISVELAKKGQGTRFVISLDTAPEQDN